MENICMTGLYRCKYPKKYYNAKFDPEYKFLFHCRNWTFTIHNIDDEGIIHLFDTYFGERELEVNEEDLNNDFELLLDYSLYNKVAKMVDLKDYDSKDYKIVLDNSGGFSSKSKYLRKGAIKSYKRMLQNVDEEIESTKNHLEYLNARRNEILRQMEK